jgi:hypothetical protein
VVDEFEKSNAKRIANFVVMGKFTESCSVLFMLDAYYKYFVVFIDR